MYNIIFVITNSFYGKILDTINPMYAGVQQKFTSLDCGRIHYLQAGNAGSPLILLHGGGIDCAAFSWQKIIEPVSSSHRVYAPDLPGYGKSDMPDIQYTMAYYTSFLASFMDVLGLPRVSLLGLSLGGGIALSFTLQHPNRVERLVLADSYGIQPRVSFHLLSTLMVKLPFVLEFFNKSLYSDRNLVRRTLKRLFCNKDMVTDDLVNQLYDLANQPGAGKAYRSFQRDEVQWKGLRSNFISRLPEISPSTLIIQGACDNLVPLKYAQRAKEYLPNVSMQVIPNCGHISPLDAPEDFNRYVLQFLSENSNSR
jgi:pimeloyl-ACP methyl ester carboxylesterase